MLQKDMKGDIQESISTAFNTHLSPFKSSIVAEISQHDNLSRSAWIEQLEEIFERYLGSQRLTLTPSPSPSLPPQYTATDSRKLEATPGLTMYTPELLKANASHLERLLISTTQDPLTVKINGTTADLEITHNLRLWWTSPSSDLLWIHSPSTDSPTTTSPLATNVVATAREADIPVLWFFCKRLDSSGNEIQHHDLFMDLIYSLIHQTVQNMATPFFSPLDFSVSRFSLLDKSPSSTVEAISIFHDLLHISEASAGPARTLVVLDGLQLLDYRGDSSLEYMINDFLDIFQRKNAALSELIVKTLVTTEEQTLLLLNTIVPERVVDASDLVGNSGFFSVADFGDKSEMGCI